MQYVYVCARVCVRACARVRTRVCARPRVCVHEGGHAFVCARTGVGVRSWVCFFVFFFAHGRYKKCLQNFLSRDLQGRPRPTWEDNIKLNGRF